MVPIGSRVRTPNLSFSTLQDLAGGRGIRILLKANTLAGQILNGLQCDFS